MLVFIAGVHGVGKGYLCAQAEKELEFSHKSASELIREFGNIKFEKDKLTNDIDNNQLILLNALEQLKKNGSNILLDGHFTLLGKDGEINTLSANIFEGMSLDGIILVMEPAQVIRERIKSRDGIEIEYDLDNLLKSELINAREISSKLGVKLIELNSPSKEDFITALKNLAYKA
ncbi:AAA family ATPase [Serratia fonticola]|uniref:ATP-binding protein n=1 Tax=Serratia fonticola TaxID=47917 RepID=UPI0015C5EFE9|nr:ATP-binding protein [Serratia fonticola]NXZ87924.1 AAA family ATPase [Serratia fonticola]